MVALGTKDVRTLDDGWTVETKDRRPSAHFEHTVAMTTEGPGVLTPPGRSTPSSLEPGCPSRLGSCPACSVNLHHSEDSGLAGSRGDLYSGPIRPQD